MEFIESLNDAQREAVLNTDGPALVIAGAGAGKTRVLTYRIANLISKGVPSYQILALTFTNKAAREMKERIVSVVGTEASRYLWMGTFHSIFSRILRAEGEALGYKPNFTIYDAADSKQVVRQIIREMNLDDKLYPAGQVAARISGAKDKLITAAMYLGNAQLFERDKAHRMPMVGEIYKKYAVRCFRANAMDFDDLLVNTYILFRDFPEVLRRYQEKYHYVLVDEYQDTNFVQYMIVRQLSALHGNLCVVGDDAQSIYSFRGARIDNIFDFRKDYPEFRIFKLEQNYRSTQTIVKAANSIIEKNREQIEKTIFSKNEMGDKIRVFPTLTDSEEGLRVASDIFETYHNEQARWLDFAILYRTNAQSRIFEETLRKKNIPYRVYGGLSFYERKEIKDILAYFRMIINQSDEEALRRSVNYPRRGIGNTTVERLYELAGEHNVSVWDIADNADRLHGHFNAGTCSKLKGYTDLIKQFALRAAEVNAFTIAKEVALQTGILAEFRDGRTVEDISRLENLEQLLNAIQEFSEAAETNGEPSSLADYLAVVALLTDQDTGDPDSIDRVTLMTAHSAKGLEFRYVYVTGLEENLFPSLMSSGTAKELEEERRLFYVAVTRAMKRATLSYALNRYKWGNLESCNPSRFIREIDSQFVAEIAPGRRPGYSSGAGQSVWQEPSSGGNGSFSRGGGSHSGRGGSRTGSGGSWSGSGSQSGRGGSGSENGGFRTGSGSQSGRGGSGPGRDGSWSGSGTGESGYSKHKPSLKHIKLSSPQDSQAPDNEDNASTAGGDTAGGREMRPAGGGAADGGRERQQTGGAAAGGRERQQTGGAADGGQEGLQTGGGAAAGGRERQQTGGAADGGQNTISSGDISIGDRVRHERFGPGTVVAIEGRPPDTTAVVDFTESGRRKLLLRFAKLVRI
ncbi:MAG: 3'-5' exonuclease [Bacteroidales bacterium]